MAAEFPAKFAAVFYAYKIHFDETKTSVRLLIFNNIL